MQNSVIKGSFIIKVFAGTVYCQVSAVLCDTSFVRGKTRIVSPVTSLHRLYCKDAELWIVSRNHNPVVCGQIDGLFTAAAIESPVNVQRHISFCDRTRSDDRVIEIQFIFPEREWRNYWQNFWRNKKVDKLQNSAFRERFKKLNVEPFMAK